MKKKVLAKTKEEPVKFATFGGVFTPSVLTILGVIMFLRFPIVVGYGGLQGVILILLAAKFITLVTGLSLSSVATNMKVRGGGAYYLISRSLGLEFGGMIAIFFYSAQAIAVSIYVFGFTEVIFTLFPGIGVPFILFATFINIVVFLCVYVGAKWTIRIQYGILAILLFSLLSFWIGGATRFSMDILKSNLAPSWGDRQSFFALFALFFPAVTGIMAGVNMSGDLKDPGRSLPKGTLMAIGFTALIYLSIAFLLASSSSRGVLVGGSFVIRDIAFWGPIIYAGVICATLSSAMGSMMGAPRIIQAFARDNIFNRIKWLGRGSGVSAEPRRAIILTFIIAQGGIMTGGLDNVAPIITMFFLITYGTINLACFYEMVSGNPSFRPTFKVNHWLVALSGALACVLVMFMINAVWAIAAMVLVSTIYFLIARAEIIVQWGDLQSGLVFQRARKALLRLEKKRYHPKNWRPSILTLSGGPWNRLNLVRYASFLSSGKGLVSLAQIIAGDLDNRFAAQIKAEKDMRNFIREEAIEAFPVVVVDQTYEDALKSLLQCHGIGGLRPNTVLIGWSQDAKKKGFFSSTLNLVKKMKRSLLIVKCRQKEEFWYPPSGAINVWWNNDQSGPLMIIMAFLLRENPEWRGRPLRILYTLAPSADREKAKAKMKGILTEARIDAEVVILPAQNQLESLKQAIQPSAVLFAGFEPADSNPAFALANSLGDVVGLPCDVILVYNAGDVSLGA